jgi:hypothetical protein
VAGARTPPQLADDDMPEALTSCSLADDERAHLGNMRAQRSEFGGRHHVTARGGHDRET